MTEAFTIHMQLKAVCTRNRPSSSSLKHFLAALHYGRCMESTLTALLVCAHTKLIPVDSVRVHYSKRITFGRVFDVEGGLNAFPVKKGFLILC